MADDKQIKILDDIEKAKKAKIRAEKKLQSLEKQMEMINTQSKIELLDALMSNAEIKDYLVQNNSIDKSLLDKVIKQYE